MKMHYLTYVFIPNDADIEEAVADAMAPFDESLEVKPYKEYLPDGEIPAMARNYGIRRNALRKLAEQMEDWKGAIGGVDEKGLYAALTYNPDGEWDWYEIGGRWDGFLEDNEASADALLRSPKLKSLLPHDFLPPDGEWHAKERYVSTGWCEGGWKSTSEGGWLAEFKEALARWPDHTVVCVDRHC